MTEVRQISIEESEERHADSLERGKAIDPDHARTLYRQYADEGHLVVLTYLRGDQPGESWWVHCAACKDNPWNMTVEEIRTYTERDAAGGSAKPPPFLLNFGQAQQWARDHRLEQGLEKQDAVPSFSWDYIEKKLAEL